MRQTYVDSINFPSFPINMEDLDFVPYKDDGEKNTRLLITETEAVDYTGLPILQQ